MKLVNENVIDFHARCDCGVEFLYNKYDVERYDGYCAMCPICARTFHLDIQSMDDNDYYYPRVGTELGGLNGLEYKKDDGTWVESGVIRSRLTPKFIGRYRCRI